MPPMETPQDIWLDQLQSATHYNQWIFAQIQPHLKGRTLEVGCGNGNFTTLIAQQCPQLVAIDLNADYVEQTKARLRSSEHVSVVTADATELDSNAIIGKQTFDTIILLDVLEHIENDVELLQRLRQSLSPDGTLLLKVPALDYLYNSLDKAVGHHRRYTPKTLQDSLTRAAFAAPAIKYFNMVGILGWWLNGAVLKRTNPPGQQVGLFDRCVPLFQAVEDNLLCPAGLSLFATATPDATRL